MIVTFCSCEILQNKHILTYRRYILSNNKIVFCERERYRLGCGYTAVFMLHYLIVAVVNLSSLVIILLDHIRRKVAARYRRTCTVASSNKIFINLLPEEILSENIYVIVDYQRLKSTINNQYRREKRTISDNTGLICFLV